MAKFKKQRSLRDAISEASFKLNGLLDKAYEQNLFIEVRPICVVMPPRDPKKLKVKPVIIRYKGSIEEKEVFNSLERRLEQKLVK